MIYKNFIESINEKNIIELTFKSKEKWIITRECIPFDFWPSRIYKDWINRYHFYDLNSPDWKHNLALLPEQIIDIKKIGFFKPEDYVKWQTNWFIERDRWIYS